MLVRNSSITASAFESDLAGGASVLAKLLLAFGALHGLLFAFDLWRDYAGFLHADRAYQRANWIGDLMEQSTLAGFGETLTRQGVIGDYVFQYAAWVTGGRWLVILMQVALALISIACLYRMIAYATRSQSVAVAGAALYGLLPHTLTFAHQLASEAVAIPLLVIGLYYFHRYLQDERRSTLIASALLLGAAVTVRPILILVPFGLAASLWLTSPKGRLGWTVRRSGWLSLALLPIMAWVGFFYVATGDASIGRTGATVSGNLAAKIGILSQSLPAEERADVVARYASSGSTSLTRYLEFAAEHPKLVLSSALKDAAVFSAKSGASRLTVDYLDLAPNRDRLQGVDPMPEAGWRRTWQNQGFGAAVRFAIENAGPIPLALEAAAGLATLSVTLFMLAAAAALAFDARWRAELGRERVALLLSCLFLAGVALGSSQIVDEFQSRHRFIADFAIVLLAAVGAQYAFQRRLRRR